MNVRPVSEDNHPVKELIILLLYVMAGGFIFSALGFLCYNFLLKPADIEIFSVSGDLIFLRTIQIFSSTGIFIAGTLVFARSRNYQLKPYFHLNRFPSTASFLLVFALALCCLPLLELVVSWNQKMVFPEFLKNVELWMRAKENEAAVLTKQLLLMNSYADLAINLLMIAIIPAIGEELLFRGAFQNIFEKWFGNVHIAIWITAIIFSAIHIQFYGFFPRMLLGAMFGYLLFWSSSLWLPVFAHFLNNGMAVIMAFVWQQQGKSIEELEKTDTFPVSGYIFSAIFTLALLLVFYRQNKREVNSTL